MKLVVSRLSFGNFFSQNKTISFVIKSSLDLFFSIVRKFCKSFAYKSEELIIVSLHRLGDTIFTIPAIREVQKKINKKFTIVCFPESVPIYKLALEDINYCELNHEDFYLNYRFANIKTKKKLKALKPGVIIDLIGGMSSASLIFNIRAKEITGISNRNFRRIYDHFVEIRKQPQLVDIYFDAVSPFVDTVDRNKVNNFSQSVNPQGKILIHPFAAWREKEWNLNKFLELALKLNNEYDVNIIIPSGKLSIDIRDEIDRMEIEMVETKSVHALIRIIKDCSLFIGNDSGPVNIANFLGIPSLTIFGATNAEFTITSQSHQLFIQRIINCSARTNEKFCLVGGAEFICSGNQCMESLSIKEVYNEVKSLASEYCAKRNNLELKN